MDEKWRLRLWAAAAAKDMEFAATCALRKTLLTQLSESKPSEGGFDSGRSCNGMDEKWRLRLWAAAAAKDMEFAAT